MAEKIRFDQLPLPIQRHYPLRGKIISITVSLTNEGAEQYTITLRNGAKYLWKYRNNGWVRSWAR